MVLLILSRTERHEKVEKCLCDQRIRLRRDSIKAYDLIAQLSARVDSLIEALAWRIMSIYERFQRKNILLTMSHLLIHQTPKLPPYRNQPIDLQSKSIDWFLYGGNFGV